MQKSLTAFVNTVLKELGNEVQHSAHQERTKLRHTSGKGTRHRFISTAPTSTGFVTATRTSLPWYFFQQRGVQNKPKTQHFLLIRANKSTSAAAKYCTAINSVHSLSGELMVSVENSWQCWLSDVKTQDAKERENTTVPVTHSSPHVGFLEVKIHRFQLHGAVCHLHPSCCSLGIRLCQLIHRDNIHWFALLELLVPRHLEGNVYR